MQGYRCGKCRKPLIEDSVFCVHCDSFFANAIPSSTPDGEDVVYLYPDGYRPSRRKPVLATVLAVAACATALLLVAFAPGSAAKPVVLINGHTAIPESVIMESLDADVQSDELCTYKSKRDATDLVLELTTDCDLVHSPRANEPCDSVLMFAKEPLTPRQAVNRAKFAMLMLRGIRGQWFDDPHQQFVRVSLINANGVWMAKVQGRRPPSPSVTAFL